LLYAANVPTLNSQYGLNPLLFSDYTQKILLKRTGLTESNR